MATITYTAIDRGDLIGDHSELTEYSFDVPLSRFQKSTKRKQSTSPSLSGRRITTLQRLDTFFNVSTVETEDDETINSMREFLSSVAAGEQFTLDPFGSILTPDNPFTVKIDGNFSEDLNIVSYSFAFRVIKL